MSTDFETLLRATEPKIRPIDPGVVIARTDRRRRRRAYAIGAGVAAGVLAATVIGWGAYGRLTGPAPAGPQPVTADCVVSQRHSVPLGGIMTGGHANETHLLGPASPNTTIRVSQGADGSYRMASAADGTTFHDLEEVGGGRCGLTFFADKNYRYAVAPVSPDAESVALTGGFTIYGPVIDAQGAPLVVGVAFEENLRPPVTAYWTTTDGSVVNSDGDDIRTVRRDGIRISVNVTRGTASIDSTDSGAPNLWTKAGSVQPLFLSEPDNRTVLLVPAGSHTASFRPYKSSDQVATDAVGDAQVTEVVPIPGSGYSAIIVRTGGGENGSSVAQVNWTTPDGKAHTWRPGEIIE